MTKIGLAISGGGTRGAAALGLLKALDELSIGLHALSGTSSGGVIAALYAYGFTPDEILQILKDTSFYRYFRPALSSKGILTLEAFEPLMRKYIRKNTFKSLQIPLTINATNLNKGVTEYFTEGDLIRSVLASCSVPTIFKALRINDSDYVDGGVLENLPARILTNSCDKVIGFHCNPIAEDFNTDKISLRRMLERALLLAISTNVATQMKYCDVFVEPNHLKNIPVFSLSNFDRVFNIGYEQAMKQKEELLKLAAKP